MGSGDVERDVYAMIAGGASLETNVRAERCFVLLLIWMSAGFSVVRCGVLLLTCNCAGDVVSIVRLIS